MNYKMIITNLGTDGVFDVSELVHDITYTTSLMGQPGKLTFQLEKDPNDILFISMGSRVRFWCESEAVFVGYVFIMGVDRTGCYQITAYDQMRYLQNHEQVLIDNETLPDFFKRLCIAEKIDYAILGKAKTEIYKIAKHFFNDVSIWDMIKYAITETNSDYISEKIFNDDGTVSRNFSSDASDEILGVYYFIRDNCGVLELNDIESNVKYRRTGIDGGITRAWTGKEWCYYDESLSPQLEPLIIGDESLLTDYKYQLDIDKNTYNQLYVLQNVDVKKEDGTTVKQDKLIKPVQSNETIEKWGLLRKIVHVKGNFTEQQLEEYVKLSLKVGAQISKTMKIEALGYNGINAGDGFILKLDKLGIEDMVYVINATHHYGNDVHTMTLDVATSKNMVEIL